MALSWKTTASRTCLFFRFVKLCSPFIGMTSVSCRFPAPIFWDRIPRIPAPISFPNTAFFSKYGGIWEWASWHRARQHFDLSPEKYFQAKRSGILKDFLGSAYAGRMSLYEQVFEKKLDTWDYQWSFARSVLRRAANPQTFQWLVSHQTLYPESKEPASLALCQRTKPFFLK